MEGDEKVQGKSSDMWVSRDVACKSYDSDSNPFEDERAVPKIKPEVELKEETEGFVYKADVRGHLKLVCSDTNIPNSNSDVQHHDITECSGSSHYSRVPVEYKNQFVHENARQQPTQIKLPVNVGMQSEVVEDGRYSNSFLSYGPHALMAFTPDMKYISEQPHLPQQEYAESHHSKQFIMDEMSTQSRCCTDISDSYGKVNFQLEMPGSYSNSKQIVAQVRENGEASWLYDIQGMRVSEDVANGSGLQYVKDSYEELRINSKRVEGEEDLWQLYQELLMQKKMEGKMVQSEEQRREKMKEIGRIRAKLYRAKLRQNDELWKKHKAMRAQKQREERRKLSEEQREKVKALARIRAKKHREKLKENEEAWKKYKAMRAEKQRMERLKMKEQLKAEARHLEVMRLAEQSEKLKELARERAKRHRERIKQDSDMWVVYKEGRAQKKREERLTMPDNQRERLKELARIRARKYREKLKEDSVEWQKYKEMRARKQREDRMNQSEEQKQRAKELARERAKLYRERKRMKQQICDKTSDSSIADQPWYDSSNSESNNCSNMQPNSNCSVYFYHAFLQNVPKGIIENS